MTINLENTCRCCFLSDDKQVLPMSEHQLFDENEDCNRGKSIVDSYFEVCVKPTEATLGLFMICTNCRLKLQNCVKFRALCQKSNEQFQRSWIKKENDHNAADIVYNDRNISNKYSVSEVLISQIKYELESDGDDNTEQHAQPQRKCRLSSPRPSDEHCSDDGGEFSDNNDHSYPEPETHQCLNCFQKFDTDKLLWRHIVSSHNNSVQPQHKRRRVSPSDREVEIKEETEEFTSYAGGDEVDNTNLDFESHQCLNCNQKFGSQNQLCEHITYSHYARATRKPTDNYVCRDCALEFTKVKDMDAHVELWHPDKIIYFPCFYCKKTFRDLKSLKRRCKGYCEKRRNDWKRLQPEQASISCDCCYLKFHEEDELDCHKITVRSLTYATHKENKKNTPNRESRDWKYSDSSDTLRIQQEVQLDESNKDEIEKHAPHEDTHEQDCSDSDSKGHICLKCQQYFDTYELLKQHVASMHINARNRSIKTRLYSCRECGLGFDKVTNLDEHVHKLHPDKTIYFPCFYCKRTAPILKNLKKRCSNKCDTKQKIAYGPEQPAPTIKCNCCNLMFHDTEELDCHRIAFRNREAELNESFYCEICNMRFLMRFHFVQHMREVHNQKKVRSSLTAMCSVCGKLCVSKGALRKHSNSHLQTRDFKCDICPNSYKTENHLRDHRKGHFRVKEFQCNECNRLFAKLTELRVHLLRMHFPSVRRFSCKICNKLLTTHFEKVRHEKTHTAELRNVCHICSNIYSTEASLQRHIQVRHTTLRYECKFCNKKLAAKKSMWKHIFVHRGFYPFNCPACEYGCYPKDLMKRHLKTKHGMQYDEKLHGYHKETVNDVLRSGINFDGDNAGNFRGEGVNLNSNYEFLNQKIMENAVGAEQGKEEKRKKRRKKKGKKLEENIKVEGMVETS